MGMSLRKGYPDLLMQFNKRIGSPEESIICVVEGDDELYYRPRVSAYLTEDEKIEFVTGDGKSNVIRLHSHVLDQIQLYGHKRFLFFADRDFDFECPALPRRYITKYHSIENFYVGEICFKNIIRNKFNLESENSREELDEITKIYLNWSEELAAKMLDFNAWLVWQTIYVAEQGKPPAILNLKNIKLSDLFKVQFSGTEIEIKTLFTLENYNTLFPNAYPIEAASLQKIKESLGGNSFLTYVRGKFAIQFLQHVLTYLKTDARSDIPSVFRARRRTSIAWSDAFLSEYSSYAETSSCLARFLRDNL